MTEYSLANLHFQLMQDPYYGYPPREKDEGPVSTKAHQLVHLFYQQHDHAQVTNFKQRYENSFYGNDNDVHRELILLWTSFLKLPVYHENKKKWSWTTMLSVQNEDFKKFYFEPDELKLFLRKLDLPLPHYFFFDEPDNTKNLPANFVDDDKPLLPIKQRQNAREERNATWQRRINDLATLPQHEGKTHVQLCEIVAEESIGAGSSVSTIARCTDSPNKKS